MVARSGSFSPKSILLVLETPEMERIVSRFIGNYTTASLISESSPINAWDILQKTDCDMVIMGWRFPEISGLALFNRLRSHGHYELKPIMVVSTHIKKAEFSLLEEFPCTKLCDELVNVQALRDATDLIFSDARWLYSNLTSIETAMDLADNNGKRAVAMMRPFLQKSPNPLPLHILLIKRLREAGSLDAAETLANDTVKIFPHSVAVLGELGKLAYLRGRDHDAQHWLNEAQAISPNNVARLCLLGNIELSTASTDGAMTQFGKALDIDPTNTMAQAGRLFAKKTPPGKGVAINSLASSLNVSGVTQSRGGQFVAGIEHYQAAYNLLTDQQLRARVAYNLGLAYVRWENPVMAKTWLQRAVDQGQAQFPKAKSLLDAVDERIAERNRIPSSTESMFPGAEKGVSSEPVVVPLTPLATPVGAGVAAATAAVAASMDEIDLEEEQFFK